MDRIFKGLDQIYAFLAVKILLLTHYGLLQFVRGIRLVHHKLLTVLYQPPSHPRLFLGHLCLGYLFLIATKFHLDIQYGLINDKARDLW